MMKMTKRKIIVFVVLAALAGGGFLAWRSLRGKNQEPTYTTATVERGTIVATVSGSGNLVQTNSFTVTTSVTGVVKEVLVKDGQQVEKGQNLVEIAPNQESEQAKIKAWSAYLAAKDAVTAAEQNKLTLAKGVEDAKTKLIVAQQAAEVGENWDPTDENKQKLNADRRSAELTLELAERKYQQADAAIEKAKIDLDAAWLSYQQTLPLITAPQAGKISDISVVPGMMVSASDQKLLCLMGEQKPLLSVAVSEIDIGKITTGQKATLSFDALPDKNFTGKVVGVDRTGTATQGVVTYPVLIQLDTGGEQFYANMTATAAIIVEAKESVLWVPPAALRAQAGQTVARVLVNGQVQEKPVEVGLETSDRAEIKSGLNESETVIVSEQATSGQAPTFGGEGGFRMMMR